MPGLAGKMGWDMSPRARAAAGISTQILYTALLGAGYGVARQHALSSRAVRWLLPAARPAEPQVYGFAAAPAVAGRRVFAADLTGKIYAFDDPRR